MKYLEKIFVTGIVLFFSFSIYSEEENQLAFKSIEVASGLYMLIGVGGFTGGNIGLSIGEDGVVIIDDSMPPMLSIMKTAIHSITNKPIDFLINTHVHGDHTGNNATLGKKTRIVAQENVRKHLLTKGVKGKPAAKSSLPVITFSDAVTFHLNGQDAKVFHLPHAHTDGDAAIIFKQANVIHTGDVLFNHMFPFIDLKNGGSLEGYIAAQQQILALADNSTKIIPGHGKLATKADLLSANEMLIEAKNIVATLIKKGLTTYRFLG